MHSPRAVLSAIVLGEEVAVLFLAASNDSLQIVGVDIFLIPDLFQPLLYLFHRRSIAAKTRERVVLHIVSPGQPGILFSVMRSAKRIGQDFRLFASGWRGPGREAGSGRGSL
jgi:hypothetical protein